MKTLPRTSISTFSSESLGGLESALGSSNSVAWPATNDAIFVPFTLSCPILVKRLFAGNGNVASGNMDVGIYTYSGAKIISAGSVAQSGTVTLQFFDIADTYLSPEIYYMGMAINNTSATVRRCNITVIRERHYGVVKMASAFPLPATAVFATMTASIVPLLGMDLGGTL